VVIITLLITNNKLIDLLALMGKSMRTFPRTRHTFGLL